MKSRILLAAAALVALSVSTPALADPVGDLLVQADDTAYTTLVKAERQADQLVVIDHPSPPTPMTFNANTDWITITDWGSGPVVQYRGVFSNTSWWTCNRASGGGLSVRVTCTANPAANITWNCGVMHLSATALSRPVDVYDHARETVATVIRSNDGPNVPDPRPRRWGQVAGRVSCDGSTLVTGLAHRDNPHVTAQTTMGSVTTLVCEARLSPTSTAAPINPYSVTCVDPANPVAGHQAG